MKAIPERILVLSILLVLGTPGAQGQNEIDLATLTVPQSRLVPGCALSASPTVSLGGNQIRGGLWAGLPRNPWTGVERSIVADIRESVAASPLLSDGPPLSRADLTRFRVQLAEDVEEAYAAIYTDAGTHLVTVHGVRFNSAPVPNPPQRGNSMSGGSVRMARGRTVVAVFGEGGQCFNAVAAYVREITVH